MPTQILLSLQVFELYIHRIELYICFCDLLFWFKIKFLRWSPVDHVVHSFSLMCSPFSCPPTLRMFSVFCYCNQAPRNIHRHDSWNTWARDSLGYTPRNGHSSLYGVSIFDDIISCNFPPKWWYHVMPPAGVHKNSFVLHPLEIIRFTCFCLFHGCKMTSCYFNLQVPNFC